MTGYGKRSNYTSKNYRKLGRNENDGDIGGAQGDSDSDFDVKVKGSRANKISRVSFAVAV